MTTNRGFIGILALIVLAVVILGGGYWVVMKMQGTPGGTLPDQIPPVLQTNTTTTGENTQTQTPEQVASTSTNTTAANAAISNPISTPSIATNGSASFASPTSGAAPLTVAINEDGGGTSIDFGDGSSHSLAGECSPDNCSMTHMYQDPGTYTVRVLELGQDAPLGSATITVTAPVQSSTPTPFALFMFPANGSQIGTDQPTTITWSLTDPTVLQKFPDLGVRLIVDDTKGDEVPLNQDLLPLSQTSFDWNVAQTVQFVPPIFTPGKQYRIDASLQYSGNAHFTCDPSVKGECDPIYDEPIQSEIVAAKAYTSESGPFSINVSPQTAALSCTVSPSQSTVTTGQSFLLSWNSTNTQVDDINGQGIDIQGGATWGSQRITLTSPGTYTYTVTGHGYSTNPGTITCSTTVTAN